MVNFYRRFLPGIAAVLKPLTDALQGSPKALEWSDACQNAFLQAKSAIIKAVPLAHPSASAVLSLATDASSSHVGAVLQQAENKAWKPLAFFSKKLSPTQQRYSTFDRELLAIFLAIKHFRYLLEGRQFHVITDHKPLTAALHRVSSPISARQQRQLAFIAEFTGDIRYIPGISNVVADSLSRPAAVNNITASTPAPTPPSQQQSPPGVVPAPNLSSPGSGADPPSTSTQQAASAKGLPELSISYQQMAKDQRDCVQVQQLLQSPSLLISSVPVGKFHLVGDMSSGTFRPLVPVKWQKKIFLALHNISHPGRLASKRLISSRFVWSRMAKDIQHWVAECLPCQRSKCGTHTTLVPDSIPVPSKRFTHIHIDLVGPLPACNSYTHLLTIVDRSTRWPEAIPLSSTTADACSEALIQHWVSRFGVPALITSDRGPQFVSSVWSQLCSSLNIHHQLTSAFHPQSNGMVERMHRQLKEALRSRLSGANWLQHLPWVLLGIRSTPKGQHGLSPAEAVFGEKLSLPNEVLVSPPASEAEAVSLTERMASFSPSPPVHHARSATPDKTVLPSSLWLSKFVLVRIDKQQSSLSPRYEGPFLVINRSPKVFILQKGKEKIPVSTMRLKPAIVPEDYQPQHRGRGRPRKTVSFVAGV
jgi:hypothetical protein